MNRYNLRNRNVAKAVEKTSSKEKISTIPYDSKLDTVLKLQKDEILKKVVEIEEVDGDGACLYECLSRGLMYSNRQLVMNKKNLMLFIREYIYIHQNRLVDLPNGLKMSFKELIEMTHEMDVETYYKRYSRLTTTNWGGLPEIIAVSDLFNMEISVYSEHGNVYKRQYTIPVKEHNYQNKIHLLLDSITESAHYSLMIFNS